MKKLFMDFGKLDENAHLNREGTGLGLSICKKIIEQQGGTVSVKSQVGKGTMFTINLGANCRPRQDKFVELTQLETNDFKISYNFLAKKQNTYVLTY